MIHFNNKFLQYFMNISVQYKQIFLGFLFYSPKKRENCFFQKLQVNFHRSPETNGLSTPIRGLSSPGVKDECRHLAWRFTKVWRRGKAQSERGRERRIFKLVRTINREQAQKGVVACFCFSFAYLATNDRENRRALVFVTREGEGVERIAGVVGMKTCGGCTSRLRDCTLPSPSNLFANGGKKHKDSGRLFVTSSGWSPMTTMTLKKKKKACESKS